MAARSIKPKRAPKPNQTGRNDKTSRFVMLPHRVLESAAYATLDLTARALLVELVMLYDGGNNGSIFLSAKDATDRLGLGDNHPALRAFGQLQAVGLIELTKPAHFDVKTGEGSRARCWRLAWLPWQESPIRSRRIGLWEWEHYQAVGKRPDRRLRALSRYRKNKAAGKFSGVDSTVLGGFIHPLAYEAGEDFTPAQTANDGFPPKVVSVDSPSYIDHTMGMCGWWADEAEAGATVEWLILLAIANAPSLIGRAS